MMLSILIRSILISFLVAIPSPFIIEWLAASVNAEPNLANFLAIYSLAFVGCFVMGVSGIKSAEENLGSNNSEDGEGKDDASREIGTVKWFNVSKGFGFITRSNGEDVFVHYRSIRGSGRRALSEGQKVQFKVAQGDKGLQAEDVSAKR